MTLLESLLEIEMVAGTYERPSLYKMSKDLVKVETDALNEVKEQVSQGCLTRTWLLVVVWRSTRVLIPL